jgi:thiol-disulfide isomerase/thioredoxin
MSNTTYRGTQVPTRSKARPKVEAAPVVDDAEDDVYEDVDDSVEQPTGLFSTPARTVTLIASVGLLVVLLAAVVWIVSSRGSTTSNPTVATNDGTTVAVPYNGPAIGVSTITKANLGGEGEAPSRGAKVPDFEWNDVASGKAVRLTTLGKPVLVNFWGTWCPPCRQEMPEMQKLYDKYKDQVEFVGVSMGPRDSTEAVKNFINHPPTGAAGPFTYTWRFVHDGNYDVATRYQVSAVPSSYFVGTDGVIRAVHIGGMNREQIESYLQQVK